MNSPRTYPSMMPKSDWVAPKLAVGDVAVVLYGCTPHLPNTDFFDLECGSTVVVAVKRNGSVKLANGMSFHDTGYGHRTNNACVISTHHAIARTKTGGVSNDDTSPATRPGHYSTF